MFIGMLCLFCVSFAGLGNGERESVNGEREKNSKVLLYNATVMTYI